MQRREARWLGLVIAGLFVGGVIGAFVAGDGDGERDGVAQRPATSTTGVARATTTTASGLAPVTTTTLRSGLAARGVGDAGDTSGATPATGGADTLFLAAGAGALVLAAATRRMSHISPTLHNGRPTLRGWRLPMS